MYYCAYRDKDACTIPTKWQLRHPDMSVGFAVFSLMVSANQWFKHEVDWCVYHGLQSNEFVGRPFEEEEDGEN